MMTVDQIDAVAAGTCQCGCCGGGEQEPKAAVEAAPQARAAVQEPRALADDDNDEQSDTRSAGCQCGEGSTGCNCSGGADCNCGSEQVA